jgi:hypothetical protein
MRDEERGTGRYWMLAEPPAASRPSFLVPPLAQCLTLPSLDVKSVSAADRRRATTVVFEAP